MVRQRDDQHLVDGKIFEAYREFIHSEATLYAYRNSLLIFLSWAKLNLEDFMKLAKTDSQKCNDLIWRFTLEQKERVRSGEIQVGTVRNHLKALKKLLEVNDILNVNWSKIRQILPKGRRRGLDRAPTIAEIRKVYGLGDLRLKCFVSICVSSGLRVGAWESLDVGHIKPIEQDGKVLAAKVLVYPNELEEYETFITPEAYQDLENYLDYRRKHGETITDTSPIIRNYFGRRGAVEMKIENVKRIGIQGIYSMMSQGYWAAGLRLEKKKRHEFKADHGFRKYFKTKAENVMKSINVETLLGHSTGLGDNYYRPSENDLLEDYLQAVPLLTIAEAAEVKHSLVAELKEERELRQELSTELKVLKEIVMSMKAEKK